MEEKILVFPNYICSLKVFLFYVDHLVLTSQWTSLYVLLLSLSGHSSRKAWKWKRNGYLKNAGCKSKLDAIYLLYMANM